MVRYSFPVGLFHPRLPAGLSRRFRSAPLFPFSPGGVLHAPLVSCHVLVKNRRMESIVPAYRIGYLECGRKMRPGEEGQRTIEGRGGWNVPKEIHEGV